MMSDEENLTIAQKTAARMEVAAGVVERAANKAKENGLSTRHEAEADKKSINLTTFVAAIGTVFAGSAACAGAVWFVMSLMLAPVVKQADRIEVVQAKQGEAMMALQLDMKGVLSKSEAKRSERLAHPPVEVVPK